MCNIKEIPSSEKRYNAKLNSLYTEEVKDLFCFA